jgi:hypothetical protein
MTQFDPMLKEHAEGRNFQNAKRNENLVASFGQELAASGQQLPPLDHSVFFSLRHARSSSPAQDMSSTTLCLHLGHVQTADLAQFSLVSLSGIYAAKP